MTRGMEKIVGDEVARVFGQLVLCQERDAPENERGAYDGERRATYDLQCGVQSLERNAEAKRDLSDILPLPHEIETLPRSLPSPYRPSGPGAFRSHAATARCQRDLVSLQRCAQGIERRTGD